MAACCEPRAGPSFGARSRCLQQLKARGLQQLKLPLPPFLTSTLGPNCCPAKQGTHLADEADVGVGHAAVRLDLRVRAPHCPGQPGGTADHGSRSLTQANSNAHSGADLYEHVIVAAACLPHQVCNGECGGARHAL